MNRLIVMFTLVLLSSGNSQDLAPDESANEAQFLAGIRQLTYEGKRSGEGYFSADGSKMIFQSERDATNPFYQIYLLDFETGDLNRISPGHGKTTCAWLHPDGEQVLFASTQNDADAEKKQSDEIAERKTRKVRKYSWDYDENYDIFESDIGGSYYKKLTNVKGYDAEGSYSPDGKWIAFASNRHAYTDDLSEADQKWFELNKSFLMDIYIMKADGSDVKRLTDVRGYDGGPFFSADGQRICWRRFNEKGDQAEIWTMNVDGTDQKAITQLEALSWAPYFHPSGEYLIFATNLNGFANFELYLVDADGARDPVRVTWTDGFDGLPAFSPDGKQLSWTTKRGTSEKSQIFIANWNHEAALKALHGDKPMGATEEAITAKDVHTHIAFLASEELQGRLPGTEGEIKATAYAAEQFARFGLLPAGDHGSFFQEFEFTSGVDLGPDNQLTGTPQDAAINEDWTPLSFSNKGDPKPAEVVFVGYGIEMPEGTGDDGEKEAFYGSYVHLDVADKWVMMFRYMPEDLDPEARQRFAKHSSLRFKALTARQKGARGIIIVSGPNAKVKKQLVPLGYDASMAGSGISAISITDAMAEQLLKSSGKDLQALQDTFDSGKMAAGFTLTDVSLGGTIDIQQEKRTGRNVLARLPASEADADLPAVIFGAHIDHLGPRAGAGSRARDGEENQVHFGADDNASGVAGMFEIAEYLADRKKQGTFQPVRDIIFAAWSGEEMGLLGSSHFVREAAREKGDENGKLDDEFAACLNMDMIGRLRKSLVMQGVGSSSRWPQEIEQRNAPIGLPIVIQTDSYISTDATSFYLRGVPILNAFTGAHDDYHTPRDTTDKINFEGAEKVIQFMALITRSLALNHEAPDYIEAKRPDEKGSRTRLRVYLGTIPDYSQGDVKGVKLSGVASNGPADKAGIKSGDIIISLAGKELENIYDYTYVMGALKIDEETDVVVLRKSKEVPLKITPGSRE